MHVDYYSGFIETAKVSSTTSTDVVTHLKSIFARHGIPDISDNGPQYSSSLFAKFSREYKFNHITSSPRYPQANGEAERAVKTIKAMLDKCSDPYLGLLAYRTTPLENGYSPAKLLMGQKIQSTLPVINSLLMPNALPFESLMQKEEKRRRKMKQNFYQHHKANSSRPLQKGEEVWLLDTSASGTIQAEVAPRSYLVHTDNGDLRQNRKHLVPMDLTRTKVESPEIELPQVQQDLPEILPEEAEVILRKGPTK